MGFVEKGVPYIIVITNGIIGYRDSAPTTDGEEGKEGGETLPSRATIAKRAMYVRLGTRATLRDTGENSEIDTNATARLTYDAAVCLRWNGWRDFVACGGDKGTKYAQGISEMGAQILRAYSVHRKDIKKSR